MGTESMRFDDLEYCEDLIRKRQYPKIHNDIFTFTGLVNAKCVIDLGCCHGLLSCRLAEVYDKVIGIEPSEKYIGNVIRRKNVKYVHMGIAQSTLQDLRKIIIEENVTAIFARRVVPEIWETGGMKLCGEFAKTIYECGVEWIALEGRKKCKNPKNALYNADKECEVFRGIYSIQESYKDCRLLKRG